jgi:hypothetical protein
MGKSRLPPGRAPALTLSVAALALAALPAPALADWQDDLAAQLRWDHGCLVQYYSGVIERMIEGQLVVIAKAHCEDGRRFDATQRSELEDFEITECTPTEQAC